jgi:hypothetical protein
VAVEEECKRRLCDTRREVPRDDFFWQREMDPLKRVFRDHKTKKKKKKIMYWSREKRRRFRGRGGNLSG